MEVMKRGDITTVNQLSLGDRFYKKGSSSRKAYEFVGAPGNLDACSADKMNNGLPVNKSSVQAFKGSTVVIFLRNVNDK